MNKKFVYQVGNNKKDLLQVRVFAGKTSVALVLRLEATGVYADSQPLKSSGSKSSPRWLGMISPYLVQTEETNFLLLQESFLSSTGQTARCSTTGSATEENFNHSSRLLIGLRKAAPGVISPRKARRSTSYFNLRRTKKVFFHGRRILLEEGKTRLLPNFVKTHEKNHPQS